MDNTKYMKQSHKPQTTKSKTRTIGVNTEEIYSKCNCNMSENMCPRFILVPYLPYYYPMCTNNNTNNCCSPNFNINPNILNQYQFVHNGNNGMKHNNCDKHSAINLLHCCSSSNCTTCTNTSSSACGNNQPLMNTVEVNTSHIPVKKNCRENGLRKSSQDKINENTNEKQYCDEEMTRYATELLDNQNYKITQEYDQTKSVNNEEKKMLNHLLTPTRRKYTITTSNQVEDSDECLDSENDETSSIEEDIPVIKVNQEEEEEDQERKRPNTTDRGLRSNFNSFNKNFNKPNGGKSSDLEMLMMLKAFVSQSAEKDVNPKLNQLINHLSSQETSIKTDGQIDSKKSLLPRK